VGHGPLGAAADAVVCWLANGLEAVRVTHEGEMRAAAGDWLTLIYKLPPEPARERIAIWRQLKALGAVYLQQGVCVLPLTPAHRDQLAALARRIRAAQGEAALLEARLADAETAAALRERYAAARAHEYGEIVIAVRRLLRHLELDEPAERELNAAELERLKRWYTRVVARDCFGCPERDTAAHLLQAAETALRGQAQRTDAARD
jgi:hypothetical protein